MEVIKNSDLRLMIESAANHLQNKREYINDLNIFPVPDGDTGTNMGMTFTAASRTALESGEDAAAGEILVSLAKASLRNARGNSGVILSQILRGLSTAVSDKSELKVADIKNALCQSRDTAYRAVMKPTEGTILTVVRETAEFAEANYEEYTDILDFAKALLDAAKASLDRTPEILPVLKQAGVVDAGGMGVVTLMEGAVLALCGDAVKVDGDVAVQSVQVKKENIATEDIKFLYCTEFLINKTSDRQATPFKAAIESKGDCMLVIEDEEIVKVHIHTNHPGFVIEQALKLGELTNLKIDNMKYQHEEKISMDAEDAPPVEMKQYGFVAVSAGEGLDSVFTDVGADKIVSGGQTMNPSTEDLLNAVQEIPAETVFILPNNKNIILAAEQVNELTDRNVIVIPTKNIPQGISAMLAFDEDMDAEENTDTMKEAMDLVKCGQVTFAARDSVVDDLEIHKDDIMGMVGSSIEALGKDINEVAVELTEKMVNDESGVISIYYGTDADKDDAEKLEEILAEKYDDLDVSLIYGGQPVYYYFIAVE